MISALLLGALSLAAMFGLDWRLGLAGALAVPLYVLALRWYLPRSGPVYARERAAVGERSQLLVESMQGVRTVHAYRLGAARTWRPSDGARAAPGTSRSACSRSSPASSAGSTGPSSSGWPRSWWSASGWSARRRHGRPDRRGGGAVPPAVQPDRHDPVHLRRHPGGRREPGPAGRRPRSGGPDEPPSAAVPADASLELRDVSFSYDGRTPVLPGSACASRRGSGWRWSARPAPARPRSPRSRPASCGPDSGEALIGGVPAAGLPAHRGGDHQPGDARLRRPADRGPAAGPPGRHRGRRSPPRWPRSARWTGRGLPEGSTRWSARAAAPLTAAQAQQLALARLVLLDPAVAVLDEATAEAGSAGARVLEEAAARRDRGPDRADRRAPADPGRRRRTGSSCWSTARSSSRARTPTWSRPAAGTPGCGRRGSRAPLSSAR